MNLKKKDLVIIAGIIVIGLMIYVVLFTDIFMPQDQPQAVVQQGSNTFRNFNSNVDKKPTENTTDKAAAYEAEYKKKKEQEGAAEADRAKREAAQKSERKVDDLSKVLGKEKVAEEKEEPVKEERQNTSTLPSSQKKQTEAQLPKKVTPKNVVQPSVKTQNNVATEVKRRGDPTFGDESTSEPAAATVKNEMTPGAPGEGTGVIHEEKKIQQNSTLKIRVTDSFKISNCEIKNNSFLTGYCRYDQAQGRMLITITSISCNGVTTAVRLDVYDGYDNQLGLAMKEATDEQKVGREVAGGVAEDVSDKLGVKVLKRATQSTAQKKSVPSVNVVQGHKVILKEFIK